MNFSSLTYFMAVEEERNFTRAAEKLHITQQTLGAHIAATEKELGCPLFIRHKPLELTEGGRIFKEYAMILNQTYESMLREIDDLSNQKSGVVRIGVSVTRGRTLMPDLIAHFAEQYPGYEVQIIEGSNSQLQEHLLNNVIDLVIANFSGDIPGIRQYPFYEEEVVMVVAEELLEKLHVRNIREIDYASMKDWPFIMGKPDDMAGQVGRQFFRMQNIRPRVKAQAGSMETILRLCMRGIGAAFCQRNLLQDAMEWEGIRNLRVISLPENARYQICFGLAEKNRNWKILMDLMDIARENRQDSKDV